MHDWLVSHYPLIRLIHIGAVVITACLMLWRLWLAHQGRDYRRQPVLRVLPHLIDTILLGSALMLAVATSRYPFVEPWLTAKFLGLCGYIITGAIALAPDRPTRSRRIAAVIALLIFSYIVAVAITRNPLIYVY